MPLPTSARFIIKGKKGVLLVKNEADGLWTLPGGNPWEGCENYSDFARVCLYRYFDGLLVKSLDVVVSPEEEIIVDGDRARCSVLECRIDGSPREDAKSSMWFAPKSALVPQALSADVRGILDLPEVQSRLT